MLHPPVLRPLITTTETLQPQKVMAQKRFFQWHCISCTLHSLTSCPPLLQLGHLVTLDTMSNFFHLACDIMFKFLFNKSSLKLHKSPRCLRTHPAVLFPNPAAWQIAAGNHISCSVHCQKKLSAKFCFSQTSITSFTARVSFSGKPPPTHRRYLWNVRPGTVADYYCSGLCEAGIVMSS